MTLCIIHSLPLVLSLPQSMPSFNASTYVEFLQYTWTSFWFLLPTFLTCLYIIFTLFLHSKPMAPPMKSFFPLINISYSHASPTNTLSTLHKTSLTFTILCPRHYESPSPTPYINLTSRNASLSYHFNVKLYLELQHR